MCESADRGYSHEINRLILNVGLAASCLATIVAVSLIGASGAVLLLMAGLLTAVLVLDEELARRARRLLRRREVRGRTASGRPIPVGQARGR